MLFLNMKGTESLLQMAFTLTQTPEEQENSYSLHKSYWTHTIDISQWRGQVKT